MKQSSIKSLANKNNLKNGLAFAYRAGNFFENSIGKTISDSNLAAPVLEGDPEPGTWYRIDIPDGISGDGSGYYIYLRKGTNDHLCIFFSGGGVAWLCSKWLRSGVTTGIARIFGSALNSRVKDLALMRSTSATG